MHCFMHGDIVKNQILPYIEENMPAVYYFQPKIYAKQKWKHIIANIFKHK